MPHSTIIVGSDPPQQEPVKPPPAPPPVTPPPLEEPDPDRLPDEVPDPNPDETRTPPIRREPPPMSATAIVRP